MPREFSQSTAEQVVAATNAVTANGGSADASFVCRFADISQGQAEAALKLAMDLGLLSESVGMYSAAGPFCRFLNTPNEEQKVAVLRIVLESHKPFTVFRDQLAATHDTHAAAQQTKALLELQAHREEVKETLLDLGTFSQALFLEGGGRYRIDNTGLNNDLQVLAQGCADRVSAEARIREQLGQAAADRVSYNHVIIPLADGLIHAVGGDPRSAVLNAGIGIESYLSGLGNRLEVSLVGKNGINQKLNELKGSGNLPTKLQNVGYYLGHIRNAADHGADSEINAAWRIRVNTGLEYVYVACSFIAGITAWEANSPEV